MFISCYLNNICINYIKYYYIFISFIYEQITNYKRGQNPNNNAINMTRI